MKLPPRKTKTSLSNETNIIAADGMAAPGARASGYVVLAKSTENILLPAWKGLTAGVVSVMAKMSYPKILQSFMPVRLGVKILVLL